MNPFKPEERKPHWMGKHILESLINTKKRKPWTYSRMKMKQIARRRKRNRMARRSRRINRLREK